MSKVSTLLHILSCPAASSGEYFVKNLDEHFWRSDEKSAKEEDDRETAGRKRKTNKQHSNKRQRGDLTISNTSDRFIAERLATATGYVKYTCIVLLNLKNKIFMTWTI